MTGRSAKLPASYLRGKPQAGGKTPLSGPRGPQSSPPGTGGPAARPAGASVTPAPETTQLYALLDDKVADAEIHAARRRRGRSAS
jgi:hypothetical protein